MEADSEEDLIPLLETEGEKVLDFFTANGMVANPEKSALLIIRPSKKKSNNGMCEVKLYGKVVRESTSEKLLGIHIAADMKWDKQIETLTSDVAYRVSQIRRLRYSLSKKDMCTIANGIVNSKLRYGLAVFGAEMLRLNESDPMSSNLHTLQVKQNDMMRAICGLKIVDKVPIGNLLLDCGMQSINQMIAYSILMEMWKARNLGVPFLDTILYKPKNSRNGLRSEESKELRPRINGPFCERAANLWNLVGDRFQTTNLFTVAKWLAKDCIKTITI